MNSLMVKEFSYTLTRYIEENPLPAEVKKYVIADIYNALCKQADKEIEQELLEREGNNEQGISE